MNLAQFWTFVSYFGDAQFWIGLTVALLIIYPLSSKKAKCHLSWMIFALLPAVLISHEVGSLIKDVTMIARPCFGLAGCPADYSFPSGHATAIFAFATVVAMIVRRAKYVLPAFVLAFLVATSRVMLGYHSLVDVIGGAILGALFGFVFSWSYRPIHSYLEKKGFVS